MTSKATGLLLERIGEEIAAELCEAVYIVCDTFDVEALKAIDHRVTLAGTPTKSIAYCIGVMATSIVLVGAVDPGLHNLLADQLPEARVWVLQSVASPALALGHRTDTEYDLDTIAAKRATWATIVADVREATAPTADDNEPREPFPVSSFPRALREMAEQGAAAQGVDVGFWAVPLLGIMAGCIGATRRIALKADWSEPAIVWPVVIAPSGTGKSVGLRELERPLRDHDYHLHEQNQVTQQAYAADVDQWKAASADARGAKPEPPKMLAALLGDATLEAVIARHSDNPRGLAVVVDELAGFVRNFDRYRQGGGDLQQWLSIYDGSAILCDRKGSANGAPRISIRRSAVSIVGTIQPAIARHYLGSAEKRESGLCGRMLLAEPPVTAAQWTDRSIPDGVRNDYGRVLRSLLDLPFGDDGEPVCLRCSPDALAVFVEYHDQNGRACAVAAHDGDGDIAAALAKLRGAAARIALVLALARAAEDAVAALAFEIDEASMRAGIAIARWFEAEARRIYAKWATAAANDTVTRERGSLTSLADRLYGILGKGEHSTDELHQATGRRVPTEHMQAALVILKLTGKAESEKRTNPRGGRPKEVWRRIVKREGVSS